MSNDMVTAIRAAAASLAAEARDLTDPAPAAAAGAGTDAAGSFAGSLKNAIYAVDAQEQQAAAKAAAVESGSSDDLVGAMLSSQQASLSFSMLMQVRNKVVGAFDDLIKLQL